jgi:recombination protein RecR
MVSYSKSLEKLISVLNKLPGIGPKTAQRLAFYLLKSPIEEVKELAASILQAKEQLKNCSVCGNITESDPCVFCQSPERDKSLICVVEQPQDIFVIEKTREFNGVYHVLMGALSPLDGIGPDDLKIIQLLDRIKGDKIKEIIVATNPNVEGETTAMYLAKLLHPLNIKITRLAHGIPMGGDLEYADEVTLAKALEGRTEMRD